METKHSLTLRRRMLGTDGTGEPIFIYFCPSPIIIHPGELGGDNKLEEDGKMFSSQKSLILSLSKDTLLSHQKESETIINVRTNDLLNVHTMSNKG